MSDRRHKPRALMALVVSSVFLLAISACSAPEPSATRASFPDQAPAEPEYPEPTARPPVATAESRPSPGAVATNAPDLTAAVQAEFANLAAGRILYNPPEEMTVGERERVEVRITQDMTVPLTDRLQGRGTPKEEPIPVTSFMKVRLTGDGFEITPLSSEEQIVVGNIPTEWSWDVVPQEAGSKALVIIVTARVKLAGFSDEQKDLTVIERRISVRIGPAHLVRGFVRDNRGWLFPSIVIPILLAAGNRAWKTFVKRKRAEPENGKES